MAVRLESNGRLLRTAARPLGRRAHRPHRAAAAAGARARPAVRRHDLVQLRRRRHRPDRAGQLQHRAHPRGPHLAGVVGRHLRAGVRDQPGARRAHDVRRDPPDPPRPVRALRGHDLRRPRDPLDRPGGERSRLAQRGHRRRREGLRDARRVPRPAALRPAGPATSARSTPTSRRSRSGTTTRPATTGIPASVLDDDRYTERRCDVLAARGRRAWQEYMPVPVSTFVDRARRRLRVRPDLPPGPARAAPRPVRARHALLPRRQRHLPRPRRKGSSGPSRPRWLTESVIASRRPGR